jgi:hypothetical protein
MFPQYLHPVVLHARRAGGLLFLVISLDFLQTRLGEIMEKRKRSCVGCGALEVVQSGGHVGQKGYETFCKPQKPIGTQSLHETLGSCFPETATEGRPIDILF